MKVNLNTSILQEINTKIDLYGADNILSIELTKEEYINFLEELSTAERVILGLGRTYKEVKLIVVD